MSHVQLRHEYDLIRSVPQSGPVLKTYGLGLAQPGIAVAIEASPSIMVYPYIMAQATPPGQPLNEGYPSKKHTASHEMLQYSEFPYTAHAQSRKATQRKPSRTHIRPPNAIRKSLKLMSRSNHLSKTNTKTCLQDSMLLEFDVYPIYIIIAIMSCRRCLRSLGVLPGELC